MSYRSKCSLVCILWFCLAMKLIGGEPFRFRSSIVCYKDLSDTYGKGSALFGNLSINKSWYGANIDFGYFQGRSIFIYKIDIEQINKTIEMKFDEISFMKCSAISFGIIPVQKERFQLDLSFGAAMNFATSSQFNRVDYEYDLVNDRFTYIYKDYKLIKRNHFGYQVGLNLSLNFLPKIGLQISSKIQDLNNGGTFFFVGAGLSFKL